MNGPPLLPARFNRVFHESVSSTNDEAKLLARHGAAAGTVVWALEQISGRGRSGHAWSSPRGNLYASLILRPACSAAQAAQLGFVAALAIADALGELGCGRSRLSCKWPNDVLLDGRKIAGILLESEISKGGQPTFLIVGVGVNLVSAPSHTEFPAISLAAAGAPAPAPETALDAVLRHFDAWARQWQEQGFAPVREAWRKCAFARSEQIRARLETTTLYGRFVDIDQQGALLLETGGELRRISAGDVFPAHG